MLKGESFQGNHISFNRGEMEMTRFVLVVLSVVALTCLNSQLSRAEVVLGDVDYDNAIGLGESISALRTVSGEPTGNLSVSSVYSAKGTYVYNSASHIITSTFTHTSFPKDYGPPLGVELDDFVTLTGGDMILTNESGSNTFTLKMAGTGGGIVGVWEAETPDGDIYRLEIGADSTIQFIAFFKGYNTAYLDYKTITIDGGFSDWALEDRIYLDDDGADCDGAGQDLAAVYMAQDDEFIYLRYTLSGPPDPDFGYKFGANLHTYIGVDTQVPPNASIFYTTPIPGVTGTLPDDSYVAVSGNEIEFKIDLCAANWDDVELEAWLDDHDINTGAVTCSDFANLPDVKIERTYCHTASNSTMEGVWLLGESSSDMDLYYIADNGGNITGHTMFNEWSPPGTYQVQADGSFSFTLNYGTSSLEQLSLNGQFTSKVSADVEIGQPQPGKMLKSVDLSLAQGTWSGTLTHLAPSETRNVSFTVNENGEVTSFTGLTGPVSGKVFVAKGHTIGFFETGESGPWGQLKLDGFLANDTLSGAYEIDDSVDNNGTFVLTR